MIRPDRASRATHCCRIMSNSTCLRAAWRGCGRGRYEAARQAEEAATLLDGGFDEQTVQRIQSPADIPCLFEEVDLLRIAGLPRHVTSS